MNSIEDKQFMVIKRDGRREPFDREKIRAGVHGRWRRRPVSQMSIENIVTPRIEDAAVIEGQVPTMGGGLQRDRRARSGKTR
jgi:transcriptional repressor NrdR